MAARTNGGTKENVVVGLMKPLLGKKLETKSAHAGRAFSPHFRTGVRLCGFLDTAVLADSRDELSAGNSARAATSAQIGGGTGDGNEHGSRLQEAGEPCGAGVSPFARGNSARRTGDAQRARVAMGWERRKYRVLWDAGSRHNKAQQRASHPYFTLLERDHPQFNLDKPWHRIVVHRVPVMNNSSSRSLVEELRWSNDGIGTLADVMGVRDRCSFEGLQKRREGLRKGIPQATFFMLMLLSADAARDSFGMLFILCLPLHPHPATPPPLTHTSQHYPIHNPVT
ncbi:hypothetical protein C8J57DRAFT_1212467 [Mycena rebaudengoi]|nr:hypothetical protein C8J57DRAFT_1212467 [Mycena rebaudengoi]